MKLNEAITVTKLIIHTNTTAITYNSEEFQRAINNKGEQWREPVELDMNIMETARDLAGEARVQVTLHPDPVQSPASVFRSQAAFPQSPRPGRARSPHRRRRAPGLLWTAATPPALVAAARPDGTDGPRASRGKGGYGNAAAAKPYRRRLTGGPTDAGSRSHAQDRAWEPCSGEERREVNTGGWWGRGGGGVGGWEGGREKQVSWRFQHASQTHCLITTAARTFAALAPLV